MKIPVLLINWDAIETTESCIERIWKNTDISKVSILVIDNGSREPRNVQVLKELKKTGKIDKVISIPDNLGFSIAFNIGFDQTGGEIFCFVSNDCLVEKGWLEEGLKTIKSDNDIAAACSNVYLDQTKRINTNDNMIPQLYGAIMFLRRKAWDDIGCLDYENFSPCYSEELDWSYRATKKGYKLMRSGRSIAYHGDHGTIDKKYKKEEIHLIRLTHRMKCRLLNLPVSGLISYRKQFLNEIRDDARNRTLDIFILACLKNLIKLPKIIADRRKRLRGERVEFRYPYRKIVRDEIEYVFPLMES